MNVVHESGSCTRYVGCDPILLESKSASTLDMSPNSYEYGHELGSHMWFEGNYPFVRVIRGGGTKQMDQEKFYRDKV